ncbi:hypothetical protein [uncultured Phenylobacterium sp.]|uniref:hypothetical protein n=1 Tax=uncultured Phenylobacterium sp. TaxID=349273 RepID=UPI0025FC9B88|nr:hypothetical protein [uncultured Phenylobacterium sp.]
MPEPGSWAQSIAAAANGNADFAGASRWLDTKIVLRFGAAAYWFKLYRGRIIDAERYNPGTNMLGYDVVVAGEPAAWRRAFEGVTTFGRELGTGQIGGDGDRVELERSYKAVHVLGSQIIPQCGLPPEVRV